MWGGGVRHSRGDAVLTVSDSFSWGGDGLNKLLPLCLALRGERLTGLQMDPDPAKPGSGPGFGYYTGVFSAKYGWRYREGAS